MRAAHLLGGVGSTLDLQGKMLLDAVLNVAMSNTRDPDVALACARAAAALWEARGRPGGTG
jgi:hypothetical protein